jgi:transposase InsO family protein
MDICYLPHGLYQLTLIDDCTRLTKASVLKGRTMAAVLSALPDLSSPQWEKGLKRYLRYYNRQRLHSALNYQTPWAYAQ